MRFDSPAGNNPIDELKIIGKPLNRIDGPLKTTGRAPYAYERHDVAPNAAYGYVLGSAIAKGRIEHMDISAAKAAAGVIAVVTAENEVAPATAALASSLARSPLLRSSSMKPTRRPTKPTR